MSCCDDMYLCQIDQCRPRRSVYQVTLNIYLCFLFFSLFENYVLKQSQNREKVFNYQIQYYYCNLVKSHDKTTLRSSKCKKGMSLLWPRFHNHHLLGVIIGFIKMEQPRLERYKFLNIVFIFGSFNHVIYHGQNKPVVRKHN